MPVLQHTADSSSATIAKASTWPEILKLALATYIPAAMFLAALAYGLLKIDTDTRLQKLQAQEAAEVNISKQLLAHDFEYATSDLLYLAHAPSVSRYINDGSQAEKQRVTEHFRNMAQSKGRYDQIRYIDSGGKEKIRVNMVDNKAVLVPDKELQDKSDRYFFRDTLRLNAGEIYISPLDLNVENGKIAQPYTPTLRLGTPLFNRAGKKMGILLINYHGQELLDDFTHSMREKNHAMLLNSDGYWLSSPDPTQEWGFMFGIDNTFGKHHPEAWAKISSTQQGSMLEKDGLYTFTTFHLRPDALHNPASSMAAGNTSTQEDYFWKIVSLVPASELPAVSIYQYPRSFTLFILNLVLLALLAIYFANTRLNRKHLRAAVFESEARLKEITATMGEGIFVIDQHERITFINPEAERLLGWPHNELIGRNAHKSFHYHQQDGTPIHTTECEIQLVIRTGNAYRSTTEVFWRKDGTSFHVDISASPIVRNGKNVGAVVAFSDISKQKQAELSLLNSRAQLIQAQRLAHMGSWELDLTTHRLIWSDEIYRIFEMNPATFGASYETFLNAIHPEDREHVNQVYSESIKNHTPYNIEHRLLFADGYTKYVLERGETFYDADGHPVRSIGTVQDITDHKLAEEERLRAEALFHMVFNNVADAIIIHDFSGHFLEVNEVFCERMGYSREELLQMSPMEINVPEDADEFSSHVKKLKDSGNLTCEMTHISRDGRRIPVEISARLIEYKGKTASLSVVRDISERRATQEALRTSMETSRALLNATTESAVLIDTEGNVLAINKVGAQRLRKQHEEIIGKNIFDLLPSDIAASRKKVVHEIVRTGQPLRHQDEHSGIHFDLSMYPILNAQGNVSHIAIYAADITERIKLQAEETLLHHIDQQVMRSDSLHTLLQFICNEIVQLFGYQFAWLGKKEAGGEFSISAQSGSASAYLTDLLRIGVRWDDTPQGRGPAGTCVRSGHMQTFTVSDISFQPWHDAAMRFEFQSIAGIPLIVRGEVYGALMLYSKIEDDFSDTITVQRLSGIASRICVALEAALDQEQLRLLSTALSSAGNGVFITNSLGQIQWINKSFSRLTGYSSQEAIGRYPSLLKSGKQDDAYYKLLWDTIQQGKTWSKETVEKHKSGKLFTVQQTITPIRDDAGTVSHYVSILDDITAKKETAARIQYMAHFDTLTALPNRALFRDRLRQTLAQAKRDGQSSALMFIDLDRFKSVNDTLGHHIGDLLLQAVADRLKACVREADTVSRLAGDEFTVLLPHVSGREDASLIAEKITASLASPFILEGHEVSIGSSTGIAFYPADADNDEKLIKCADQAMYVAKEQGRGTFRFYQAPN